jgi:hypothetical protein
VREALELGMVVHATVENVVVRGAREPDAVPSEPELRVELAPDDQRIVPVSHVSEDCTADRAPASAAGYSPG